MVLKKKVRSEWEEYRDENPRDSIPNSLQDFLTFAQKEYRRVGATSVNMTHLDDDDDDQEAALDYEVENQISDCGELLLLFRDYLEQKARSEGKR